MTEYQQREKLIEQNEKIIELLTIMTNKLQRLINAEQIKSV